MPETLPNDLIEHFRAFELLDDDAPMRGFVRVIRCGIRDWQRLYEHPALGFDKPFDVRFAKAVVKTLGHLVGTDAEILFGYAEHGEFSLLLNADVDGSNHGGRWLVSRIASNSAAKLSLLLGDLALFDVHLYQFPSPELARIYFQWRQQCQERLSLDRWVFHALHTKTGDEQTAQTIVADLGTEEKLEILVQHEMQFDEVPVWQRRGAGVYWQNRESEADKSLLVDTTLPTGDAYSEYLKMFL
ncbi:MAG: tRNA(His) guanylyltransferase Thg1 family protein [bacterium]